MRVSIITVTLNSSATLEATISSVLSQGIDGLEYIIVDGGSTDGTVDIIKQHHASGHVAAWKSEKDDGISDAFNKGLAMATGDVIGIINSDDTYPENVLKTVQNAYEGSEMNFILHGNMLQVGASSRIRIKPRPFPALWKYVDSPYSHPGMFIPRRVYDMVGCYNEKYRYAMDFDLFLRAMKRGVLFKHIDMDLCIFSSGGRSCNAPLACHREVLRSQLENGLFAPLAYSTFLMKVLVNKAKGLVHK